MRAILLLCLLPGLAVAGPTVRWLNRFGDARTEQVAAVESESLREVRLKLADGTRRTIPVWRLLELARERGDVPGEAALLRARRDVYHEVRLGEAAIVLDRILKSQGGWQKEYAAAARAVLAEQRKEKDASARLAAFRKDFPDSRFTSWIVLAQARQKSRAVTKPDLDAMLQPFPDAIKEIEQLGGPVILRFHPFIDGGRRVLETGLQSWSRYMGNVAPFMEDSIKNEKDVAVHAAVFAVETWGRLEGYERAATAQIERKDKPYGPLAEVAKMSRESSLALPEVRCDLLLELGRLHAACGNAKKARDAYAQAKELGKTLPDPRRRLAAEEGLKSLAKG